MRERCGKAREAFVVASELGDVPAMVFLGKLLDKYYPQRFAWFGRAAAASYGEYFLLLDEMSDQIRLFGSGTGSAKVVFVIGQALKGHINNEKRRIFGNSFKFDTYIGPANQALRFYEFQLQSYQKAVDSWIIETQSCEGHSKNDWEDDLGCERRSSIFGRGTANQRCSHARLRK
jgi:hypothetical protein